VRHPEGWDTNRKPTLPKGVAGRKPTLPKGVVGTNQNQHSQRVWLEQKHLKPTSPKGVAGQKNQHPRRVWLANIPEGCGWTKKPTSPKGVAGQHPRRVWLEQSVERQPVQTGYNIVNQSINIYFRSQSSYLLNKEPSPMPSPGHKPSPETMP
jgi:hypothetical protein